MREYKISPYFFNINSIMFHGQLFNRAILIKIKMYPAVSALLVGKERNIVLTMSTNTNNHRT